VGRAPSRGELESVAIDIAERAEQLVGSFSVIYGVDLTTFDDANTTRVVRAALIDSSLANARRLGAFLGCTRGITAASYLPGWNDPVTKIGRRVVKAADRVEGDPTIPVAELAVALVGGLCRFSEALDAAGRFDEARWFDPSPRGLYDELLRRDPLGVPTIAPKDDAVARLTRRLNAHLVAIGAPYPTGE
jgi:hypothetical protein